MFSDPDLIPISALQHLVYCERQAMLIHLESAWGENRHTAEGRRMHERTHAPLSRLEEGRVVARGLRLVSYRLGLIGAADVVEFHPLPGQAGSCPSATLPVGPAPSGLQLPRRKGQWQPFPVEYKRGRPKAHDADAVQLCAQALCLEEMLGVSIPAGALFYGQTRRCQEVTFGDVPRRRVESCAARLHELMAAGATPPPVYEKRKCESCSLRLQCLPDRPVSANRYLQRMMSGALQEQ